MNHNHQPTKQKEATPIAGLRDEFAMAALPALCLNINHDRHLVARQAYQIADAMMHARKEPQR